MNGLTELKQYPKLINIIQLYTGCIKNIIQAVYFYLSEQWKGANPLITDLFIVCANASNILG
jgi:hypothetical protein